MKANIKWFCLPDDYIDEQMRHTSNLDYDNTTRMYILNRETGSWYKEQIEIRNKKLLNG